MQNNTTETKKLEVVGMLRFETDISEFCKSDGFTALTGKNLKKLVAKLEKNDESVSEDLKEEIVEALSNGNGYTEFLKGDDFAEDEDLSPEARFIVDQLEDELEASEFKAKIYIRKNEPDWLNYEFKLATEIDYIPYKQFIETLDTGAIDFEDKARNLNEGADIEGYDTKSLLYKLYQEARKTRKGNAIFTYEGRINCDTIPDISEKVCEYIKKQLYNDLEGNKYLQSDLICEAYNVLIVNECCGPESAYSGALYNMDELYLNALNFIAGEIYEINDDQIIKRKEEATA